MPAMSVKLGWLRDGTPAVEIERIQFEVTALTACTHPTAERGGNTHCAAVIDPLMSVNAGWEAVGTPLGDIWRIHWLPTAAKDWMPPSELADGLGRSAPTKARNVGVAAEPVVGPAHTKFAV